MTKKYDSISDALIEAIRELGGSKVVGQLLKPEKLADEAGRWLRDCLNTDRREKLEIEQIIFILREAGKVGCHAAMNFICADAGYSIPDPVDLEDEKVILQREFIESTKHMARIASRIEEISTSKKIRR